MSIHDEATLDAPLDPPPEQLGPWRLVEQLGSGASGTVYLARADGEGAPLPRGARVALKVLHPWLARSRRALDRFLREGDLGARLEHPGIVRTLTADVITARGLPYSVLAQEYVPGRTWRALLDEYGTIPEPLLRQLLLHLAEALAAMHAAGLVHRDLKPTNVVVTPDHHVKILDLGVATLLDRPGAATKDGDFVGTAHYAAPEQFGGTPPVPATDLYAVGLLAYEAATGDQPFASNSFAETMRRHLDMVPPQAGARNPEITPFFEEIIGTLLAKRPVDRLATARELADVLASGERSEWWHRRARSLRTRSPRNQLRRTRARPPARLVGRDAELARLLSAWRQTQEGFGGVVMIEGEAGVGKTRLVEELLATIEADEDRPLVLVGGDSRVQAGTAVGAIARALVALHGEDDLAESLRAALGEQAGTYADSLAELLLGGERDESLSTDVLAGLLGRVLASSCAARPLVWVAEDVHFATVEGRQLAWSLARATESNRALVVLTARPELPADELEWLARHPCHVHVQLTRLEEEDVTALVRELESDSVARRWGSRIAVRSDGNPLFVREVLVGMKARGVPPDQVDLVGPADTDSVPTTLKTLLSPRLASLADDERILVDAAAVQGFTFDHGVLAEVVGRDALAILQGLAVLERRHGIVRATGADYEFDHHLLQDVTLEELPGPLAAEYHARTGEVLRQRAELGRQEPAVGQLACRLARHFYRGGRRDAANLHVRAALEHLEGIQDWEQLEDLATRAIDDDVVDVELTCDALLARSRALCQTDSEAGMADLLRARDLATRFESRRARVRAEHRLGTLSSDRGELKAGLEHLESARALASELGDSRLLADVTVRLAWETQNDGRFRESLALYSEGLELSKALGHVRAQGQALNGISRAYSLLGETDLAREALERLAALGDGHHDRSLQLVATCNLGAVQLAAGEHAEAKASFKVVLEHYRATGSLRGQATIAGNLAKVCWALGELGEARSMSEESRYLLERVGLPPLEVQTRMELSGLELESGDLVAAKRLALEALEMCRELRLRRLEPSALRHVAEAESLLGAHVAARAAFGEALDISLAIGDQHGVALARLGLATCWLDSGEPEEARSLLEGLAALSEGQLAGMLGALPAAYLAVLGARPASSVEVSERTAVPIRAEIYLALFMAGGDDEHLARCRELLERMASTLPASRQEVFWAHHRVARHVPR